jgi:hypothetical protein
LGGKANFAAPRPGTELSVEFCAYLPGPVATIEARIIAREENGTNSEIAKPKTFS